MVYLSFSWDDGAVEDLKLMDLSISYNIPGIFFIPSTNSERKVILNTEIKLLAKNNFEIGAHTYSHAYLTQLSLKKADEELLTGKSFLEQILGKEVPHFCFPGGKFNPELVEMSKQYYKSARTADTGALIQNNSYLVKPTFHFFERGKKSLIYNGFKNSSTIFRLSLANILSRNYFDLIINLIVGLNNLPDTNKIIIWGHSWEIEKFQLWSRLENLFHFINEHYPDYKQGYSELLNLQNS
jgi:peptidoglycan/xylan/chitin deacetylase (PgdA/CDA1 family)